MFPSAFQTSRLHLRPIAPGDVQPVFDAYAQDPEVTRWLTWRPHTDIEQTQAYIVSCLTETSSRTYVIIGRSDSKLLGAFDLRRTGPSRLGYGYVLARSAWEHGYMTEALTHVVDWALGQPDIWRIGDVCDVDNLASARVMQKAGLTLEGVARRWAVHPNISPEPRDSFSYAKVR